MSTQKRLTAAAPNPLRSSTESYAVTPAIGPLPPTYFRRSPSYRVSGVWHAMTGLVHVSAMRKRFPMAGPTSVTRSRKPEEQQ
jgi:hypothetical protein